MSTKRPRYNVYPQTCKNASCVEMNCSPTQPAACKQYPDLPLCTNINFDFKCTTQSTTPITLKSIKIKRNAPKIIKEVLNSAHNRALIQAALTNQNTQLKENYRINPTDTYNKILHSWLKLIMLHHLKHHVFARLAKGDHGVQIVAVKDIPAGTRVFQTTRASCRLYFPVEVTDTQVETALQGDKAVKEILNDFFLQLEDNSAVFPIPVLGPNTIDMSFFLNHAYPGNIGIEAEGYCDMSSYIAISEIPKDTPLSINYAEFCKGSNEQQMSKQKLENLVNRMQFLLNLAPFQGKFQKNNNTNPKWTLISTDLQQSSWIKKN